MTSDSSNLVVTELLEADSDDVYDLRRGEGVIFQKVEGIIAKMQEQGKIDENIQPIIVITKKKRKKKGLLD